MPKSGLGRETSRIGYKTHPNTFLPAFARSVLHESVT